MVSLEMHTAPLVPPQALDWHCMATMAPKCLLSTSARVSGTLQVAQFQEVIVRLK